MSLFYWKNRNHNISQGRPSIQYTASNNLDQWDLLLRLCERKILVTEPWFMGGYQFSTGDNQTSRSKEIKSLILIYSQYG